jgi:hypothetical protein
MPFLAEMIFKIYVNCLVRRPLLKYYSGTIVFEVFQNIKAQLAFNKDHLRTEKSAVKLAIMPKRHSAVSYVVK